MIRKRIREKIRWLFPIVAVICIIFLSFAIGNLKNKAYDQLIADRWADDSIPYHQITAFSNAMSREEISNLRNQIAMGLNAASYTEESTSGRLWADAYALFEIDTVSRSDQVSVKSLGNVEIVGAGGDFFLFHPLTLVNGCYFSKDDVMHDRVLLDKELAWHLFGAYDIAGKQIQIQNQSFTVAGVYDAGEDEDLSYAKGGRCYLYMDDAAFQKLYPDTPVRCYEVVLPNAVKNFARNLVKDHVSEEMVVIDNTERFGVFRLLKKYKSLKKSLMHTDTVSYPYWEMLAVATEWKLLCMYVVRALLFICVMIWMCIRYNPKNKVESKARGWYDFHIHNCETQ